MAIMKAKAKLGDMKIKQCIKNPHVEKDKIVLVVNQAWNASFARVANPEIHGTMTKEDRGRENTTIDSDSPYYNTLLPSSQEMIWLQRM